MTRIAAVLLVLLWGASAAAAEPIRVGSKKFTESVILGELGAHLLRDAGFETRHRRELGGTQLLWGALVAGELDLYPEYTGTLLLEILAGQSFEDPASLETHLAGLGIGMSRPFGFNNTYAIGMLEARAAQLGVERVSDLGRHPGLRFGFSNEFMDREDGWPGLRRRYGLPQSDVRGLDHDLAYRGLASGTLDATDLYSTDAEIRFYDLRVLQDDRAHFPAYHAIWLYRLDLTQRASGAVAALGQIEGKISDRAMSSMNAAVKLDGVRESQAAADFLNGHSGIGLDAELEVAHVSAASRIAGHLSEHLFLVGISLAAAIVLALPLGILAAKHTPSSQLILGIVGMIQTIPSLALLVFMIPLLGIGAPPAIVALFLYSLLPIVRNTHAGLVDIQPALRESAQALGLPGWARLRSVELPLAARSILAGIKTSAVINIGTATLGALIGAGGLGQPILTGIRLADTALILQGAVPAALLAIFAQLAFEGLERAVVPRGLRIPVSH